jgi:16S rRNA C967 or C1407 C5-methylase (RsmB/RsmF family)
MSYTNADGLFTLSNKDQGVAQDQGTTARGVRQVITKKLTLKALGTTFGASQIDPLEAMIPAGAIIVNADLVITDAATSGGSATLTIGTYTAAGAAVDADGIDAAIALTAIDADGDVVQCDGAQVSGLVTVGADPVHIGAIYGTAAYTAGTATLIVEYIKVE